FTYLANTIRLGDREIPYSLVTAMPSGADPLVRSRPPGRLTNEESIQGNGPTGGSAAEQGVRPTIALNDWAARDLGAKPGDSITLEYYVWKDEGRLVTESATFSLTSILPLKDGADRDLAPE